MTKDARSSDSAGGGMSRAAKKRAKKRQKKQKQSMMDEDLEVTMEGDEEDMYVDNSKKLDKKRQKEKRQRKRSNGSDKMQKKKKRSQTEENVKEAKEQAESDKTEENTDSIDSMVESLVSSLSPAQILLLKGVSAEDNDTIMQGNEHLSELDMNELLPNMSASVRARCLLQSLLKMPAQLFYDKYWEKQPLLVKASSDCKNRLDGFLSLASIQELLDKENMCFGRDLNVTKYDDTTADGVKRRITLDLQSDKDDFVVAHAKDVWSNYNNGCTIRLLCPHQHSSPVHSLLSTLELEWGCMVGANAYLTPPNSSQGFAPHYDDIEAFVLQLQGTKHWKVYPPPPGEALPRASSRDYVESELTQDPVLDVVLGPGDVLYMPRGWIHQACTLDSNKQHSLHLTVSAMQNWAWVDYLELLLPQALEAAAASTTSTALREGLPRNFLNYMGAIHDASSNEEELPEGLKQLAKAKDDADSQSSEGEEAEAAAQAREKKRMQDEFREEAKKRIMRVCKEAMSMIDAGCDQIGKRFLSDRLLPALTPNEASLTSEGRAENGGKIWPNTMCRLVRPGIARLALEEDKAVLYHCVDNSCVYHGNPLSPMEFEMDDAPALEALLTTVEPHWICVQDLIHDDIQDKMEIAQSLYDEGILAILQTEKPDKSVQSF